MKATVRAVMGAADSLSVRKSSQIELDSHRGKLQRLVSAMTSRKFSPSASNCRVHSAGASRSRSTPMPRGKRPSTAALTRSGARSASEMVILTCRTLHCWRVAICSMFVAEPETISSSHLRPWAIALTRRARRSIRVGRTSFRGTPSGMRICRDFLDGGFCQGIDSMAASRQLQLLWMPGRSRGSNPHRTIFETLLASARPMQS